MAVLAVSLIVGVVYMLVKLTQLQWKDLVIVLAAAVGALIYYYAYLYPRRDRKWIMLEAVEEDAAGETPEPAVPATESEPRG